MSKRPLILLAVVLLFFQAGSVLGAEPRRTDLQLPISFKVNKTIGRTYPFTFRLVDTSGAVVWSESKSYPIPGNQIIKHKLGSRTPFAAGVGGPVDFSRQLTVQVISGTPVYSSTLSVVPYALWSADSEASGEFIVRGLAGQTGSLQEWRDSAGTVLAAVAPNGAVSSSAGFVGDGSGLTNVSVQSGSIQGQVSPAAGGTGKDTSTAAKGSVPYLSAVGTWDMLGIGGSGTFLGVGATGAPEWQTLPLGTSWGLGGNAVDPPGSAFLGTTNAQPLLVKVGGESVGRIEPYDTTVQFTGPNIIFGYGANSDKIAGNAVGQGVNSAVISGGGRGTPEGGEFNFVGGHGGTIGGGVGNQIGDPANQPMDFPWSTIGGGRLNRANGVRATVSGGERNSVTGVGGTIGGGYTNVIPLPLASYGTIAGGYRNFASGSNASIGGGEENWAIGFMSSIGGGGINTTGEASRPVLDPDGDGTPNPSSYDLLDETIGVYSTVGGGQNNAAIGGWSTVPGGSGNAAYGDYSFAAGTNAKARTTGSFVWADSQPPAFPPETVPDPTPGNPPMPNPDLAADQFWVRAAGGVYLVTAVDPGTGVPTQGVMLPANGSAWEALPSSSDRNMKTEISPVDARAVLAKVAALPIATWSYRGSQGTAGPRHLGPMAQDFRAAFGLGDDDRHIAPVDASGVSLAAIQGLNDLVHQLADTVAGLERQLAEQRDETAALRAQVADLHARYGRLRALIAGVPETDPAIAQK